MILTSDLDFAEIVALSKGQKASVLLFRLHNTRISHLIRRLDTVLFDSGEALDKGAIIVAEEFRHRGRYLPIGRGENKS